MKTRLEKAAHILCVIAVILFIAGGFSLGWGRQLKVRSWLVTGFYIWGAALFFLLAAAIIWGARWVIRNVRVE